MGRAHPWLRPQGPGASNGGARRSRGDRSQQKWMLPTVHVPQPREHTQTGLHTKPKNKQTCGGGKARAGARAGGRVQPLCQQVPTCSYSPLSPIPIFGLSCVPIVTKLSNPKSAKRTVLYYTIFTGSVALGKFLDCSVPQFPHP